MLMLPLALRLAYATTNRWLRPHLKLPTVFVDLVLMFIVFLVCLAGPSLVFETVGWQVQQSIAQPYIQEALSACRSERRDVSDGVLSYDDTHNRFIWRARDGSLTCSYDSYDGDAAVWTCDC